MEGVTHQMTFYEPSGTFLWKSYAFYEESEFRVTYLSSAECRTYVEFQKQV